MARYDVSELIGKRKSEIEEFFVKHRHTRLGRKARDFLERKGEFRLIEPSTPDRKQVFPAPQPPVDRQTHRYGEYHDGS